MIGHLYIHQINVGADLKPAITLTAPVEASPYATLAFVSPEKCKMRALPDGEVWHDFDFWGGASPSTGEVENWAIAQSYAESFCNLIRRDALIPCDIFANLVSDQFAYMNDPRHTQLVWMFWQIVGDELGLDARRSARGAK